MAKGATANFAVSMRSKHLKSSEILRGSRSLKMDRFSHSQHDATTASEMYSDTAEIVMTG